MIPNRYDITKVGVIDITKSNTKILCSKDELTQLKPSGLRHDLFVQQVT